MSVAGRIAHIVAKDLRLLWLLALSVPLLQFLLAVVSYRDLPSSDDGSRTALLITVALVIAMVLAIVTVIHQEAPASTRQDWLVRPIPRGELLLAKCGWIALVIHAPIFVAGLLACLAHGFDLLPSLRAVAFSMVSIAVLFTLPFMALASVTRTLLQALVGALVGFVGILLAVYNLPDSTSTTGVRWVLEDASHGLAVVSMLAVLLLQYVRRSTLLARSAFISGLLFATLVTALPWQFAHAVNGWLAPAATAPVQLSYAPDAVPMTQSGARLLPGTRQHVLSDDVGNSDDVLVGVPLRIDNRPPGELLHVDRVRIRILDGARVLVDRGALPFDLRAGEGPLLRQDLRLSAAEVKRVAARPVRLEIDYAFTTLQKLGALASLGVGERAAVGDLRCAAQALGTTGVNVSCRALREVPDCLGFEVLRGGQRTAQSYACAPNYEPSPLRFSAEPSESVLRMLNFRPGSEAVQVTIQQYAPLAHARTTVVLPRIEIKALRLVP